MPLYRLTKTLLRRKLRRGAALRAFYIFAARAYIDFRRGGFDLPEAKAGSREFAAIAADPASRGGAARGDSLFRASRAAERRSRRRPDGEAHLHARRNSRCSFTASRTAAATRSSRTWPRRSSRSSAAPRRCSPAFPFLSPSSTSGSCGASRGDVSARSPRLARRRSTRSRRRWSISLSW